MTVGDMVKLFSYGQQYQLIGAMTGKNLQIVGIMQNP